MIINIECTGPEGTETVCLREEVAEKCGLSVRASQGFGKCIPVYYDIGSILYMKYDSKEKFA